MSDRPNILFIMADQYRWDALGCSGGWAETPNFDKIASEGVRFSSCVTNSPVCIPARVSLATGRYPHNTGVWNNLHHNMPADTPTWMQAIRNAGYRTSVFGKTHLHVHQGDLRDREHLVNAYGMDDVDEIGGPRASRRVLSHMTERWEKKGLWKAYQDDYDERFKAKPCMVRPSVLPLEDYADVYVGQQAKKYLAAYDRDQPWFCWVSFGGPHEPWDAPEPYASMYRPEDMPKPMPPIEEARARPASYLDVRYEHHPADVTDEELAAMRANYAGNVSLIDAQVGEVMEAIAARGELANTVIVFSSDHGEMNGDYGLVYKSTFLNGAVRVPLLVRTPATLNGPARGSVSDGPVEWFDIGPTLVELAGGELGHRQFARSLCPVLADPAVDIRDEAVSELQGEVMIMDRDWKMAVNEKGQPYLLFDLRNDPDERRNLAGDPGMAEVEDELRMRMFRHILMNQVRMGAK